MEKLNPSFISPDQFCILPETAYFRSGLIVPESGIIIVNRMAFFPLFFRFSGFGAIWR